MPAYKFEALDVAGKSATGLLDADNARAARAQLRAQSLVPLAVTPVAAAGTDTGGQFKLSRRVFGTTGLAVWTRQLAGLVGSGLPLPRDYDRYFRIWFILGWPAFLAMVAIFWLMIARPQSF